VPIDSLHRFVVGIHTAFSVHPDLGAHILEIASYLQITGEMQGPIEGSSERRGRDGLIELLGFSHSVEIPAQQSSRAVHRPIEIRKAVDKSSPKLMQALCTKEPLTDVQMTWYRFSKQGIEALYYSIQLKKALILQMQTLAPPAFDRKQEHLQFMEVLLLGYESIIWSWGVDGNVEYEAQWFQAVR
jgi:type VI secretion system secreted protein Hcp